MDHGLKSHPANRFGHLDGHKTVDGRRIGLILVTTRSIRLVFFHVCVNILQTCIVTISIHIYIYTHPYIDRLVFLSTAVGLVESLGVQATNFNRSGETLFEERPWL